MEAGMNRSILPFLLVNFLVFVVSGCGPGRPATVAPEAPTATSAPPAQTVTPSAPPDEGGQTMPFELTSTAFGPGEPIPRRYTCDGEDLSPPLAWGDPPQGTQSFALIADDPDAPVGTWVHWVLYDLPAGTRGLPEEVPPDADLPDGSRHGKNSWRRLGYGGPCPPSGTHRYFFKLYALDTTLALNAGANKEQLLRAMEGHILAQAELMGVYSRK
jgi:Raf kinase inhibitor-like YbhB/YbcL family protein